MNKSSDYYEAAARGQVYHAEVLLEEAQAVSESLALAQIFATLAQAAAIQEAATGPEDTRRRQVGG